ncbi:MSI3 [Symbiodinium natans]|uniref:MSI3 protein n=1 Tax=Symbiodinium natans TaxID=878477 RepID=A0A812TSM9_9DINO|nr:MSI3 [Symbiodinium natans]
MAGDPYPSPPPAARFVGIDLGVTCVVASCSAEERNAISICTNDVSGRSTPAAVSFDGKLRHVGVNAEGRLMSAPKQTISHLPLALVASDSAQKRAEKYQFLFPTQEDGKLGPVTFDGKDFPVPSCGPLSVLLRTLSGYAVDEGTTLQQLCIAVPDFLSDKELAVVHDAVGLADLAASTHLLRHSDAVAVAFAHSQGSSLLPEGTEERTVGFVDIGSSHGTVSVVRFARKEGAPDEASSPLAAGISAEFLYRCSEEELGVQSLMTALLKEAISRIEQKHSCKVKLGTKSGVRLANEAVHALKQLSMLPDAEMGLEAFMPEGPEGPEIDVSVPLTRTVFEAAAASVLSRLKEVLAAAAAIGPLEAVELVGGGGRIPAVQKLVKDAVGESVPLRFGLDGASCVASGAVAWAAGRRPLSAMDAAMGVGGLDQEELGRIRTHEAEIEAVHSEEVQRLEKRNTLESYVYQVRDWMNGKNGSLLNPSELNPYLDKVVLWFEDADMAEEPTSYQAYADKLQEVETFVKETGAAYFEQKAKEHEDQEKEIEKAAAAERERRKELGMDFDKDERAMKKEDRIRLAQKNKDEGNDMFKAQKFDDAVRRYKKAIDHVSRPEVVSNMTPDEAEEAKKIKVSCHLNSAQCYIKAGEAAAQSGGKNAAEPFYKKAHSACI